MAKNKFKNLVKPPKIASPGNLMGSDLSLTDYSGVEAFNNINNIFLKIDGSNANQNIDIGSYNFTTSGKIGIGTTTPDQMLEIKGDEARLRFYRTDNTKQSNFMFRPNGALSSTNVQWLTGFKADENSYITATWDGSTWVNRLTILNDGKVGINDTTPSTQLEVGGTITATDLALNTPSSVYLLSHDSFADFVADEHIDWTNTSERLKTSGDLTATNLTASSGDYALGIEDNSYAFARSQDTDSGMYFDILGNEIELHYNATKVWGVKMASTPAGSMFVGTFSRTTEPTTSQIPSGYCAFWDKTSDPTGIYLCYNHGGTVKTVALT